MRIPIGLIALAASAVAAASPASAFCGFYVAKADAKLFNRSSKVVVARKDERTVVTMASDYNGDSEEFALVVPVPALVGRDQIRITESNLVDQLDTYTAPRLVEYFDHDPCGYATATGSSPSWMIYLAGLVRPDMRRVAHHSRKNVANVSADRCRPKIAPGLKSAAASCVAERVQSLQALWFG
jgi:hypothetical protein